MSAAKPYLALALSTLVSAAALLGSAVSADDAQPATPPGQKNVEIGNWNLACSARGCFIFLDQSHAGNNTVEMGIDRQTKKPVIVGFITDGDADQSKSIVVTFAKTTVDPTRAACKGGPEVAKPVDCYDVDMLTDSSFSLPFADCGKGTCVARVKGQSVKSGTTGMPVDLLDEFLNANHVLFAYTDDKGTLRERMLDLDGFKDVYEAALKELN